MLKNFSLTILVVLLISLLFTTTVVAAVSKYTFNDVTIGEQIYEIEASVKDNKKSAYTNCSYNTEDYAEWLGNYQVDEVAGENAEAIEAICVENFENKVQ